MSDRDPAEAGVIVATPGVVSGEPVLLVTGSRGVSDLEPIHFWLEHLLGMMPNDTIVRVGCASGVDEAVRNWCRDNGETCQVVRAEWDVHGRAAGPIRNQRMVDMEPKPWLGLAFWDGTSRGTADCISRMEWAGIRVTVVRLDQPWRPEERRAAMGQAALPLALEG